jgi:LytS/YehU family sensor histidine kinase
MNACMGVVNWLRHYIRDQEQSQLRKEEAEQLLREAELSRLRQQLQPHFLFNSLNSISALAGSQPQQARKMIQQLSDFLRGTLKKDENQLVPLKEELQHIQLYLEIEKVRFGHRLQTELIQNVPCENCKLPSLLLQPIIENAIKFGLYDTTESVLITIRVSENEGFLTVSVRNPFDITTSKPRQGTGFGLSAIQRRLYLIYGRTDLIKTEMDNNHFETTLLIPQ